MTYSYDSLVKTLGYDKAYPQGLQSIYSTECDESGSVTNIEQCHI